MHIQYTRIIVYRFIHGTVELSRTILHKCRFPADMSSIALSVSAVVSFDMFHKLSSLKPYRTHTPELFGNFMLIHILQVKWSVYQFYLPHTKSLAESLRSYALFFVDGVHWRQQRHTQFCHTETKFRLWYRIEIFIHSTSVKRRKFKARIPGNNGKRKKKKSHRAVCVALRTHLWFLNPAKVEFSPYQSHSRWQKRPDRIQFYFFPLSVFHSRIFRAAVIQNIYLFSNNSNWKVLHLKLTDFLKAMTMAEFCQNVEAGNLEANFELSRVCHRDISIQWPRFKRDDDDSWRWNPKLSFKNN